MYRPNDYAYPYGVPTSPSPQSDSFLNTQQQQTDVEYSTYEQSSVEDVVPPNVPLPDSENAAEVDEFVRRTRQLYPVTTLSMQEPWTGYEDIRHAQPTSSEGQMGGAEDAFGLHYAFDPFGPQWDDLLAHSQQHTFRNSTMHDDAHASSIDYGSQSIPAVLLDPQQALPNHAPPAFRGASSSRSHPALLHYAPDFTLTMDAFEQGSAPGRHDPPQPITNSPDRPVPTHLLDAFVQNALLTVPVTDSPSIGRGRVSVRSTAARRTRDTAQLKERSSASPSSSAGSSFNYGSFGSPSGSMGSSASFRTPTPPNVSVQQQGARPRPVAVQQLGDGFMEALIESMTKNAETEEGRKKIDCPACVLMPSTRRNPAKLVFSKRHVDEVHLNPLALALSKGEQFSPVIDSLWMAMVALKMKRRQVNPDNRPSSVVRAEADQLISLLCLPMAQRPSTADLPALRAWGAAYAAKIGIEQENRKCPHCGKEYSRKSSRDRHNCTSVVTESRKRD